MNSCNLMKYVKQKGDCPASPHYAIIEFDSILIPGDERSRTNPGHGYPEHSESVVKYIAFTDEEAWKSEINKRMTATYGRNNNWIPVKVIPASVSVQTTVKV